MNHPLEIVCPACRAVNRVPRGRLNAAPCCGRCKTLLFAGKPLDLDQAGFARHLERDQVPLLVDFWAPWCGPCRAMAPAFAAAAAQLEPRVRLAKVDTEREPALASRMGIRSIPTLILFRRGREAARQAGSLSQQALIAWARSQLQGPPDEHAA